MGNAEACDTLAMALDYVLAVERWEGDLILDEAAWHGGARGVPEFTDALWGRLLELQAIRNRLKAALIGAAAAPPCDAAGPGVPPCKEG